MVHYQILLHFYLISATIVGLVLLFFFFPPPTVLSIMSLAKLFSREEKILLGNCIVSGGIWQVLQSVQKGQAELPDGIQEQ